MIGKVPLNFVSSFLSHCFAQSIASAIMQCPTFETLIVSGTNQIDRDGAKALSRAIAASQCFHMFSVAHNFMGPDAVGEFRVALANCPTLVEANFSSNFCDCRGVTMLVEDLHKSPSMKRLHFWDNKIGQVQLTHLPNMLLCTTLSLNHQELHRKMGEKDLDRYNWSPPLKKNSEADYLKLVQ